jgi:hypothetical protein
VVRHLHRLRAGHLRPDREEQQPSPWMDPARCRYVPPHRLRDKRHLLQPGREAHRHHGNRHLERRHLPNGANVWIHVKGPTSGASSPASTIRACKPRPRAIAALPSRAVFICAALRWP